ncbi:reverse transcriptase domain-containing protein [Tanacetum coccineum]
MLRVFPISLTGAAAHWLRNEPTGSIKTWEDLKTKFLNKYCPPGRTAKKMEEINNFQQEPDETLYQAWEHFKELLMKCPQHYLTEMQEVILFYNGLDVPTQQILDSREEGNYGLKFTETCGASHINKRTITPIGEEEDQWINRSLDPFLEDYIELNDLNEPFKLRRNQGNGLYYHRGRANFTDCLSLVADLREKEAETLRETIELRSPDFNLLSDQEYSEEEVAKILVETMEQYMSKTRANYGSGVARPKIKEKDNFELKGQFFKELRTNTFSDSDHEDANEHIEKVLEIVDLFEILNITIDQVMLRAFPMSLTGAEPDENLYQAWERFKELLMKYPQHYLMEMQEVILFYSRLGIPTRQILDSIGAIPSKTAADAKVAI